MQGRSHAARCLPTALVAHATNTSIPHLTGHPVPGSEPHYNTHKLCSTPPCPHQPFDSQAVRHHLHTTCRRLTKACCSSPAVKRLRFGPNPGHGRQACSGDMQALVKTPVRVHGCVRGSSCQAAVVAHPPHEMLVGQAAKTRPATTLLTHPPASKHIGTAPRSRFPGADFHPSTCGQLLPTQKKTMPPNPTGVSSSPHLSSQQHPAQHPGSKATGLRTIAPPQQLPTQQAMCWLCCRGHCRRCCTTALPNKKSKDPAARHIHKEGTKQPISWLSWT
jgi:hypothetical protein